LAEPEWSFPNAKIGMYATQSTPDFPPVKEVPKGSPNILLVLLDDGKQVAEGRIDEQVPQRCGTETMDVGMDCVSPVCDDYAEKGRFPFTGTIEAVTFAFGKHPAPTGMDRLKMATRMD
jgi:arylsulfatase